jgi:hypothetical protein
MQWEEKQACFYAGAPAAILAALLFLPTLAYLILTPAIPHAYWVAGLAFPLLAFAEFWGVARLVRCCTTRELDLISVLAFAALLVVLVIAIYSAFFVAALTMGGL